MYKCLKCKIGGIRIKKNVPIKSEYPFSKISTDIFGPVKTSSMRHKLFFITITDIFTRFTRVFLAKKCTTSKFNEILNKWITKYGKPKTLISDNATIFKSLELRKFCKNKNINQIFVPTYSPYSNGISESINKDIAFVLRAYPEKGTNSKIKFIERKINEGFNLNIKNFPVILKGDNTILNISNNPVSRLNSLMLKKCKVPERNSLLGRKVYIKKQDNNKLTERYLGPYTVKEESVKKLWVKLDGVEGWVHVRNLKFAGEGRMF